MSIYFKSSNGLAVCCLCVYEIEEIAISGGGDSGDPVSVHYNFKEPRRKF